MQNPYIHKEEICVMTKRRMLLVGLLTVIVLGTVMSPALLAASNKLVVYTPAGARTVDTIMDMWAEKYPDIKVDVVSAGTGEIMTRIKTERVRPQGDVLLTGGTETVNSIIDLLQPYKCANDSAFREGFKHPEYYYYGFAMPLQVFIVNTELLSEEEIPQTWLDLADPKWNGKLVMANPAVSASAYAQLSMMLQLYGWDFVAKVVNNATIAPSSKIPYFNVATGEHLVGITGEGNVYNMIRQGYPVKPVYPEDGTGLRYDTVSIIKNGPNPENAKKFIDFVTTKEVYSAIAISDERRMCRIDVPVNEGLIPTEEITFMDYDEVAAGRNRDEVLEEFDEIFSAKM
jgi:iron(III) transport system substrate-binding protein